MAKLGVFQTTHTAAGLLAAALYAKVGKKSALLLLSLYYFAVQAVKKKLKQGGIIRDPPTGPYQNLIVLDLSMVLAGPIAGQMFSELGAQVINIESTKQPDTGRVFGRAPARGLSGLYANTGRGKQSIALDLKQPAGLQAFYDLVQKADVVIQNFRPGAVDRLKVGYDDCKQINPNIIYCSSSGFGTTGPYKDLRVYDPIIQTVAGVTYAQGSQSGPALIGQAFCDKMTAMTSAQAIGAALLVRANGGGGQHIETDMLKVALQSLWPEIYQGYTFLGEQNMMDAEPADYKFLYPQGDKETNFNSVRTAMNDPFFVYEECNHVLFGASRVGSFPVSFSQSSLTSRESAVLVGEHTRKILTEIGYGSTQINQMLHTNAATSTQSLIAGMGKLAQKKGNSKGKQEADKKAMIFGLLESLQQGDTFGKRHVTTKTATNTTTKATLSRDGPLKGINVLDITMGIAGPTCTQTFADQEACVIKIEFSDLEDETRSLGPNGGSDYSAMFASLNRQKLSINIRPNEEVTVMNQLFQWADVVLIDSSIETVKAINYNRVVQVAGSSIIYCVIQNFDVNDELTLQRKTGAGDCQPEQYNGNSYQTSHSRRSSGMGGLNIQVQRKGPPPYYATRLYGKDKGSQTQPSYACMSVFAKAIGSYCANAITAALYVKATNNGLGQQLVVDARKAGCHYAMPDVQWNGVWPKGTFMKDFPELIECYTIVKTKDGKEIFTTAASDKEWRDARTGWIDTALKDHEEYTLFINDASMKTAFGRIKRLGKLYEIFKYAASQTTLQQFQMAKDVLCSPVNTRASMLSDPHVLQGNYLTEVNHPQMGRQRQPTPPVTFSQTKTSIRRAASLLDEDREIVLEMLERSGKK